MVWATDPCVGADVMFIAAWTVPVQEFSRSASRWAQTGGSCVIMPNGYRRMASYSPGVTKRHISTSPSDDDGAGPQISYLRDL